MKYILSALLFAFLIASCQNGCGSSVDKPGGNGVDQTPPPPPTPNNVSCYNSLDSTETKVYNFLAKDYWVVTGYHKINDRQASKSNRGRWYQFRPDCTFTAGHFDKVLSTGTWALESKGTHIRLNAENVTEDGLWRMQFQSDGSQAVFVGTEQYQTNSIQMRLESLLFAPKNPKEMGWE